jgi:hypothetical protein
LRWERQNYTERQTEALELLKKHYASGVGVADSEARAVFDALVARGTGLVELIATDETPTGDAYVLTDAGADAFREEAEERARDAEQN